jgi:hypothetical protein
MKGSWKASLWGETIIESLMMVDINSRDNAKILTEHTGISIFGEWDADQSLRSGARKVVSTYRR